MKEVAKGFLGTYERLLRTIQPAKKGQLFKTSNPNTTSLLLDYSEKTLEKLAFQHSFSKLFQIHTTGPTLSVTETIPYCFEQPTDVKVKSTSPSGKHELRVRKPSINGKEVLLLEVWRNGYLVKTKEITKTIKFLYNDHMFGTVAWSQDEDLAAFVAEPADKTYVGVWEEAGEEKEEKKKEADPLDKYTFKEDFGEQMPEKTSPRLFVLNLKDFALEEVTQTGDEAEFWPGSPIFLEGGELLFHAYRKTPYKQGLIYCCNRPSALYYLKDYKDKSVAPQKLTDEFLAFAPSRSPDNKKVAYIAVEKEFDEHGRCLELRVFEWPKKGAPKVVVPTIKSPKAPEFPGIFGFQDHFSSHCCGFLGDSVHYIVKSLSYSFQYVYLINSVTGKVVHLTHPDFAADDQTVLAFKDDLIVLKQSSVNTPPYNVVIKLDLEGAKGDTEALVKSAKWCKFAEPDLKDDPKISNTLQKTVKKQIKTSNAEAYLYYSEANKGEKGLIALLHGGPHSAFVNSFMHSLALYLTEGYAFLGINYRGSLGYGQNYIESLLGHIGEYDVLDCIECVEKACNEAKEITGINNLFVSGGSHGGFLTTWLIAKYPKKFKAAVARNPVVNLPFMAAASDIPEWTYAEGLKTSYLYSPKDDERNALWSKSPISQVLNVETPLLLMIGAKDKRVPILGVIPYYNIMKAKGKEVKLMHFPNDSHPLSEPETEVHSLISGLTWIEEHRSKAQTRPDQHELFYIDLIDVFLYCIFNN
eukprot:TRINITY_DN121285_c0_g1_i1.p1 TRINITY_DN121285_c0_g1~~TRINITY_DN121285_c0_g1_i1.p1  ORF type:complete len:752 (+),score=72.32 TRINITY_DN121285_c0_g1_i1:2271-4526(+)